VNISENRGIDPDVKAELDRIAEILKGTKNNLRLTGIGIFIAVMLFLINMWPPQFFEKICRAVAAI
jgi:hypothetical protein